MRELLVLLLPVTYSWLEERTYQIGAKNYTERREQPWFRYPHDDHDRVQTADKETSAFGKHFIPPDDEFVAPRWTLEEQRYLPCMTKECVCLYFRGSFTHGHCFLRDGQVLAKAHRQEIRTLSDSQRRSWELVLNQMKFSGLYNRLSRIHKYSGVHSGPAFLIWHREFLKRVELVIRRYLPDVNMGVPYWDSSLDAHLPDPRDSIIFSEQFLGETDQEGFVVTGPYANWTTMEGRPHIFRELKTDEGGELLNSARIDWVVNNPDYNMVLGVTMPLTSCPMNHKLDARMLEFSHDYVHFFIAGDMGRSHSSSNDVIFIYHHSMIDNVFEMWRQTKQSREERESQYPASHPDCFPPWHNFDAYMPFLQVSTTQTVHPFQPFKNRDGLSNRYTDEMYKFAPRPSCSRENIDCGSKYLFCHQPINSEPFCMSKVKAGGNCLGFERTEICYRGKCINGVCFKNEMTKLDKRLYM